MAFWQNRMNVIAGIKIIIKFSYAASDVTPLVGLQEGHSACKKSLIQLLLKILHCRIQTSIEQLWRSRPIKRKLYW